MKHNPENQIEEIEDQSSVFNYTVEQVRLCLPDGTETEHFANVRTDTKQVLGVVSDRYSIMQNRTLFDQVEHLFKSRSMSHDDPDTVITKNGSRVRALYRFPDLNVNVNGDTLSFVLNVQNSFDGSLKCAFQVGLFRFICSNGLVIPAAAVNLTRKHTSALDLSFADRSLDHALDEFKRSGDLFANFARTRISQVEGHQILNGLVINKSMSERMADHVREIWEKPTYREDRDRNVWSLYNSVTEHLTHTVKGKRFELSDRVNQNVVSVLNKSIQRGTLSDLMVKSLPESKYN